MTSEDYYHQYALLEAIERRELLRLRNIADHAHESRRNMLLGIVRAAVTVCAFCLGYYVAS